MGLFSKIFGATTEEGTEPASGESAPDPTERVQKPEQAPPVPGAKTATAAPARAPTPTQRAEPAHPTDASARASRKGDSARPNQQARGVPRAALPEPPRVAAPATVAPPTSQRPVFVAAPQRRAAPQPFALDAAGKSRPADEKPRSAKPSIPSATHPAPPTTTPPRRPSASTPRPAEAAVASTAALAATAKGVALELDSLRPPPGEPPAPSRPRMDSEDEIERAFGRMASIGPSPVAAAGTVVVDPITREANAELFRGMAVGFARPLRDFMLELALGSTTKQWLEIGKRPLENLLKGARELELSEGVAALEAFEQRMDDVQRSPGSRVTGAERDRLLAAYEGLVRVMPTAFDLKGERDRREPIVVHQLLLQVPGVHKVAIDKLYAAGLSSLEGLCRSSADDLMALARLDREGAEAIVRRFQTYLRERTEQALEKGEAQAKQKLRLIVDKLGKAQQEFQRAEAEDDRERKRRARRERRSRALEMNVLLAQLGEVDLVAELERSPTERRIERVRGYIESSGRMEPARQEAS